MEEPRQEFGRVTLSVLFIGALIAGSFWILSPFLASFVWAVMVVVATWPVLLRVQRALGGKRRPAVFVMTVALLTVFVLPVFAAFNALLTHADDIPALTARLKTVEVPRPPDWLGSVPVVGAKAAAEWNAIAVAGPGELVDRVEPHLQSIGKWFVNKAGSFLLRFLQFLLIVILAGVLYSGGEAWAQWARRFGRRLAFEQGERMVVLAGQAIRGVALGVVVTALAQTAFSWIGLRIVGVPFAGVLTAIALVLSIAQIGPLLVLLAATAWAYLQLGAGWGTFMLVWALVVGLMDNVLKPILIRKGADLPLLLIFAGVVGGLVTFGIVGIFVGPVVLAVAYTLVDNWVRTDPARPADASAVRMPNSGLQPDPGMPSPGHS